MIKDKKVPSEAPNEEKSYSPREAPKEKRHQSPMITEAPIEEKLQSPIESTKPPNTGPFEKAFLLSYCNAMLALQ